MVAQTNSSQLGKNCRCDAHTSCNTHNHFSPDTHTRTHLICYVQKRVDCFELLQSRSLSFDGIFNGFQLRQQLLSSRISCFLSLQHQKSTFEHNFLDSFNRDILYRALRDQVSKNCCKLYKSYRSQDYIFTLRANQSIIYLFQ